jgi:hypothetical protein
MQEQIHGLCCKQLSIRSGCNRRELPHVVGPCEFNLKSAASSIVTKAANLNIIHGLTCDVQRLNAVRTIANPFPAAGAPVEIGIEVARHLFFRLNGDLVNAIRVSQCN